MKGCEPTHILKNTKPNAKISAAIVYGCLKCYSGEKYSGVPTTVWAYSSTSLETPKSANKAYPLLIKTFWGLMSRWIRC